MQIFSEKYPVLHKLKGVHQKLAYWQIQHLKDFQTCGFLFHICAHGDLSFHYCWQEKEIYQDYL